jgi:hypothetical protein
MSRLNSLPLVRTLFRSIHTLVTQKTAQFIVAIFLALVALPVVAVALYANTNNDGAARTNTTLPGLDPAPGSTPDSSNNSRLSQEPGIEHPKPTANQHNDSVNVGISSAKTSVTVNGQDVAPDESGTVNQTVTTEDGAKFKVQSRIRSTTSGDSKKTDSDVDYDFESNISIESETVIKKESD